MQGDHLHLLAEADDNRALSEGMQGLSVRLAKGLNRMMGRHGKAFDDRFHTHVLATPTEVRNALAYVLLNHRSHLARSGARVGRGAADPFSSGPSFEGWRSGSSAAGVSRTTSPARTWLLARGWRRRGLLSPDEIPAVRSVPSSPRRLREPHVRGVPPRCGA